MQSYKDGKLIDSKVFKDADIDARTYSEMFERLKRGEVDQVVTARMPDVGEIVEVRGLRFKVTHAFEDGFRAELDSPK